MPKWGIPEKSYKNVAQQCLLDGCSTFLTDFMAEKHLFAIFPKAKKNCSETRQAMGSTWEHAKLEILNFIKIRITLLAIIHIVDFLVSDR